MQGRARRAHVRAQVGQLGDQTQAVKVDVGAAAHGHHAGALRMTGSHKLPWVDRHAGTVTRKRRGGVAVPSCI